MLLNKDFIWRAFYVHALCPFLLLKSTDEWEQETYSTPESTG